MDKSSMFKISLVEPNRSTDGYPSAMTHNHHPFTLAKSALQKYVRRCNFENALYWTM